MSTRQNGAVIRQLRKERGLRLGGLADMVELTAKSLNNIEGGRAQASEVVLYRLARALDVEYDRLLTDASQPERVA
jgi:transcriptional regulator with XRE-family HTH domain